MDFSHASKSTPNAHYATPILQSTDATQTLTHPFVDGKDGAYGGQTVNVGGAIQRIKTDYILSL